MTPVTSILRSLPSYLLKVPPGMLTEMFTLQTAWAGHSETAKGMHLTAGVGEKLFSSKKLKDLLCNMGCSVSQTSESGQNFFLSAKMYWYIAYKYNVKSMTVNAESLT